ncbi:hypothetical protein B0A55_00622 [Friedmanniomyces simplex]|uniref:2EXR domain-containing protein n=1 Tax=Friedmanniomyces simplex TaxID=329884 RepID=A0A4U0XZQ6_9PEZI|nr:hypothetical protein B0A55_00622 [Friedmanniomyces simplex]
MLARPSRQAVTGAGKSHLLALPPELRNRIYELVLVAENALIYYYYLSLHKNIGSTVPQARQPALTRVSKELRHQALAIFYGQNTFDITLHAGLASEPEDER